MRHPSGGIHLTGTQATVAGVVIAAGIIGAWTRFDDMRMQLVTVAKKDDVQAISALLAGKASAAEVTALQTRMAGMEQMSAKELATLRGEVASIAKDVDNVTRAVDNITRVALQGTREDGRR